MPNIPTAARISAGKIIKLPADKQIMGAVSGGECSVSTQSTGYTHSVKPTPFYKRKWQFTITVNGITRRTSSIKMYLLGTIKNSIWLLPGPIVHKNFDRDKNANMVWTTWIEENAITKIFGYEIKLYEWKLLDGKTVSGGMKLKFLRKRDAVMFALLYGGT